MHLRRSRSALALGRDEPHARYKLLACDVRRAIPCQQQVAEFFALALAERLGLRLRFLDLRAKGGVLGSSGIFLFSSSCLRAHSRSISPVLSAPMSSCFSGA